MSTLDRFCPRCGGALDWGNVDGDDRPRQICVACGHVHYQNPTPTAGALVVRNGELLLARRAIEPYFGYWDIPGGFIESGEGPAETAIREVKEETGLEVRLTRVFGFYLDHYGLDEREILNIYFQAEVIGGEPRPGDDASEVAWFMSAALPERIAFRHAPQVLEDWRAAIGHDG
jgi:ADP-ribose pyrophosphatase YjhB (NUDIX family)